MANLTFFALKSKNIFIRLLIRCKILLDPDYFERYFRKLSQIHKAQTRREMLKIRLLQAAILLKAAHHQYLALNPGEISANSEIAHFKVFSFSKQYDHLYI